jgi:hypothetical protein
MNVGGMTHSYQTKFKSEVLIMKDYINGEFPTLTDIVRDYYEFKEVIRGIKTVNQVKDLVDETLLCAEINGMTVAEYIENGCTDEGIEWIRYDRFGCLRCIYDRFDGNLMFDVWSEACDDDFIRDITIDKLTEEVYNETKADAITFYRVGQATVQDKGNVIVEFVEGLIEEIVENLYNSKFDSYEELNQFELASIKDNIIRHRDYREMLINGTFISNILELYKDALDSRIQYYKYTIPYSGYIEITVKAHSEEEADDYIDSMSHYSLVQHLNEYDVEFDTYDKDLEDMSYDEPFEDYEDAT